MLALKRHIADTADYLTDKLLRYESIVPVSTRSRAIASGFVYSILSDVCLSDEAEQGSISLLCLGFTISVQTSDSGPTH